MLRVGNMALNKNEDNVYTHRKGHVGQTPIKLVRSKKVLRWQLILFLLISGMIHETGHRIGVNIYPTT